MSLPRPSCGPANTLSPAQEQSFPGTRIPVGQEGPRSPTQPKNNSANFIIPVIRGAYRFKETGHPSNVGSSVLLRDQRFQTPVSCEGGVGGRLPPADLCPGLRSRRGPSTHRGSTGVNPTLCQFLVLVWWVPSPPRSRQCLLSGLPLQQSLGSLGLQ